MLGAAQLVARGGFELGERVGAEVGQRMPLEPSPQILRWIELGTVAGQQAHLDRAVGALEVVANNATPVLRGAVPHDHQPASEVCMKRLEELDDLRALDGAVVQPKHAVAPAQAGDRRDMLPVEVKLDDRGLAHGRPGAHPRGPLGQARSSMKTISRRWAAHFF